MHQHKLYLLECAEIHGMENVLCIIWMLFKRDRFLEGLSLDDGNRGNESEHRETPTAQPSPRPNMNMLPTCY